MSHDDPSRLTGGCGCGAVRFEIDAPLVGAAYCLCIRCQRRSGTGAAGSATIEPGPELVVALAAEGFEATAPVASAA